MAKRKANTVLEVSGQDLLDWGACSANDFMRTFFPKEYAEFAAGNVTHEAIHALSVPLTPKNWEKAREANLDMHTFVDLLQDNHSVLEKALNANQARLDAERDKLEDQQLKLEDQIEEIDNKLYELETQDINNMYDDNYLNAIGKILFAPAKKNAAKKAAKKPNSRKKVARKR